MAPDDSRNVTPSADAETEGPDLSKLAAGIAAKSRARSLELGSQLDKEMKAVAAAWAVTDEAQKALADPLDEMCASKPEKDQLTPAEIRSFLAQIQRLHSQLQTQCDVISAIAVSVTTTCSIARSRQGKMAECGQWKRTRYGANMGSFMLMMWRADLGRGAVVIT